MDVIEMLTSD